MTGLLRRTVSPSSSIMSRSTPWVDGCWGPMLMIIVSSGLTSMLRSPGSRVTPSGSRSTAPCSSSSSADSVALRGAISWAPSDVSIDSDRASCSRVLIRFSSTGLGWVLELNGDATHGVVLSQRMTLPVLRHEDAGEVGVALEADAHHVEDLSLHGVGPRVEAKERRHHGLGPGDLHPQPDAAALLEGEQAHDQLEALRLHARGQPPAGVGQVVHRRHVHAEVEALLLEGLNDLRVPIARGVEHLLPTLRAEGGSVERL